jgi:hypothetical protein
MKVLMIGPEVSAGLGVQVVNIMNIQGSFSTVSDIGVKLHFPSRGLLVSYLREIKL